jgi:hypothetical protein
MRASNDVFDANLLFRTLMIVVCGQKTRANLK